MLCIRSCQTYLPTVSSHINFYHPMTSKLSKNNFSLILTTFLCLFDSPQGNHFCFKEKFPSSLLRNALRPMYSYQEWDQMCIFTRSFFTGTCFFTGT